MAMELIRSLKYGSHQYTGRLLQQWLEVPKDSSHIQLCPVKPSNLDIKHLKHLGKMEIELNLKPQPLVQIEDYLEEVEIQEPDLGEWHKFYLEELRMRKIDPKDWKFNPEKLRKNIWEGQTAPGVIVIEEIKRKSGPYSSQISQAIYEHHFPMETLKYVYMVDVQNEDTLRFVKEELYTRSNGVLEQEDEITERYEWEYGTPEFEALLGTRLGRHVAFLILGALERGTRRIESIRTWYAFQELQMQFIIGDITPDLVEEVEPVTPVSLSTMPDSEECDSLPVDKPTTIRKRKLVDLDHEEDVAPVNSRRRLKLNPVVTNKTSTGDKEDFKDVAQMMLPVLSAGW